MNDFHPDPYCCIFPINAARVQIFNQRQTFQSTPYLPENQ